MSTLTQFTGGGGGSATPKKVTTYTSGTGTFTPQAGTTWMKVTLVGGGGALAIAIVSGNDGATEKGFVSIKRPSPGQATTWWLENTQSSYTYAVGAGGLRDNSSFYTISGSYVSLYLDNPSTMSQGGNTTFGSLTSYGGLSSRPSGTVVKNSTLSSNFYETDTVPTSEYGASGKGYGAAGDWGSPTTYGGGSGLIIVEEYA